MLTSMLRRGKYKKKHLNVIGRPEKSDDFNLIDKAVK